MTPRRSLALVHEPNAGPGVFADAIRDCGWTADEWLVPSGEPPPGDPLGYDAVIVYGGAMNADEEDRFPWLRAEKDHLRRHFDQGVPLLGVCLGSQLLAEVAGAPAERAPEPEIGWFKVEVTAAGARDPVIGPLAPSFEAFQWHSYRSPVPPGAVELATSHAGLQAFRLGDATWGIQFHAEVSEEDAVNWAVNFDVDPDAVRIGIDPEELTAEIRARIGAQNELGRELVGRFLEAAGA